MNEPRTRPAERCQPHMQIPALLIAFVLAPGAAVAVAGVVWPIGIAAGLMLGVIAPDGDASDAGHFLAPAAGFVCALFWIVYFPALLVVYAMRELSIWTVVAPAVLLPWGFVATLSLWSWAATGMNSAPAFVTLSLLLVPETTVLAIAFWFLYCFFTGETFYSPPPWRKAVPSMDDAS